MSAVETKTGRITKILMLKVWNLPSSQIFCKYSLLRTGIDHPGNGMSNSGPKCLCGIKQVHLKDKSRLWGEVKRKDKEK